MRAVAGDITTDEGRAAALAACPQVDILVNNAGGPPPGDFRDWDRDAWLKALDANMLTPIELIKATVDDMAARGFGRIVNITSGAVKAPIDVARPVERRAQRPDRLRRRPGAQRRRAHNVTINSLLPGAFDTDRLRSTAAGAAKRGGQHVEAMLDAARARHPGAALRHAEEFGAVCAFLCSVHAGYITGQNLLIDGGAYPGTF